MKGTTHIAAGVLTALAAYKIGLSHQPFELITGAFIASTLPDIDQKVKMLGHRRMTHGIIWPLLLYIASVYFKKEIILGTVIGWLSHIVIDSFNSKGCELFWPLSKKNFPIMKIKYDGVIENVLLVLMCIGIIGLIVSNFVDVRLIAGIK